MTSNSPSNTNLTSPNNILSPPLLRHNPSDVRVVSQSQSRTRSHSNANHNENYQLDRLAEAVVHHDFASQTPMREMSAVALVSTPVHSTHTKKQRVESATSKLFTTDPVAQGIALEKREDLMATTEKRNRKFGNPQDGILWWLRADRLSIQPSTSSKKALKIRIAN